MYENLDMDSQVCHELMAYLSEQTRQALYAYSEYYDQLKIFRRAIAAAPVTKLKTFPWPGASNLIVPLIRIAGDAVKARITNTLLAPQPFWVCTAPNGDFQPYAKPVERFMEWAAKNDLDLVNTTEAIVDQITYLGKCPVKICWQEIIRKIKTYDKTTKKKVEKIRTIKDGPLIEPILLENWLEPWGLGAPEHKQWNSYRVFHTLADLVEMEAQGLVKNVSKLKDVIMQKLPPDMIEASELRKIAWANSETVQLWETHIRWDYDGDKFQEELIVLWHYDADSTPLSLKYNFFHHGYRPIEIMYYLRDSYNRGQADGLAQLLNPIQESLSTYWNQRTDNITIANTRAWKGKRGEIKKTGPNSQIFPGQVVLMGDPEHDLLPMEMGTVTPQSFQQESGLRDYAERLSGISDPQLGREFNNPRVAATTTLSVLQEGNRRFDMIVRLSREIFSRIGTRVLQLYQQFGPRVELSQILNPEDEVYVTQLLSMSPDDIEQNFLIQLNTSSATANKETQRQGLMALYQLINQFYSQILQVAMQVMINPQIPDPVKDMIIEMAQASYVTIKEIVQTYDITDPSTFLVDVAEALNFIRTGGDIGGVESAINSGLANLNGMANGGAGNIPGGNPNPIPTPGGLQNQQQLAGAATGVGSQPSGSSSGVAVA